MCSHAHDVFSMRVYICGHMQCSVCEQVLRIKSFLCGIKKNLNLKSKSTHPVLIFRASKYVGVSSFLVTMTFTHSFPPHINNAGL